MVKTNHQPAKKCLKSGKSNLTDHRFSLRPFADHLALNLQVRCAPLSAGKSRKKNGGNTVDLWENLGESSIEILGVQPCGHSLRHLQETYSVLKIDSDRCFRVYMHIYVDTLGGFKIQLFAIWGSKSRQLDKELDKQLDLAHCLRFKIRLSSPCRANFFRCYLRLQFRCATGYLPTSGIIRSSAGKKRWCYPPVKFEKTNWKDHERSTMYSWENPL